VPMWCANRVDSTMNTYSQCVCEESRQQPVGPVQRTDADGDHNADDQGTHAPDIESSLDLEDDSDEYSAGDQLPLPLLLLGQREQRGHTHSE